MTMPSLRSRSQRPMHPGELFKNQVLPALALSISEAARGLRVSRQTLHRMIAGTHAVTPEMALRLGRFCGSGPHLWLRMQQNYDLWNVARDGRVEIEKVPARSEITDLAKAEAAGATASEKMTVEEPVEDEIGRLYDEIAELTQNLSDLDENADLARGLIEAQIDAAYTEVRRLQTEEAEQFRRAFEASLELPLGEGPKAVRETQTLIHALEQIFEGDGADRAVEKETSPEAQTTALAAMMSEINALAEEEIEVEAGVEAADAWAPPETEAQAP